MDHKDSVDFQQSLFINSQSTSPTSKEVGEVFEIQQRLPAKLLKNNSYCFDESSPLTGDQVTYLSERVNDISRKEPYDFESLFEKLRKQPREFTILSATMPTREPARVLSNVLSGIEPRYTSIFLSRNKTKEQGKTYVQTFKNRNTKTIKEGSTGIYYFKKQDD